MLLLLLLLFAVAVAVVAAVVVVVGRLRFQDKTCHICHVFSIEENYTMGYNVLTVTSLKEVGGGLMHDALLKTPSAPGAEVRWNQSGTSRNA